VTVLRHPHIEPVLEVDVADDRVAAHLAAGWLPVADSATPPEADEPPAETPNRPRRRRAGSDSPKETAE
jgi:hypothetical protein